QADPFVLHLFAALAEKERQLISSRTRAGLQAAKARKVKLGMAARKATTEQLIRAGAASAARADQFARDNRLVISGAMRATGNNLTAAAKQLNNDGHRSAEGKLWERR